MSTILELETSRYSGVPVDLFLFERGNPVLDVYAFTTADDDVVYGGVNYKAGVFGRDDVTADTERGSASIQISIPNSDALSADLKTTESPIPVSLKVFRTHQGASDVDRIWIGQVASIATDSGVATLLCEPVTADFDQGVPRVSTQRNCPWMLFDESCGLLEDSFTTSATISAISGKLLTVTGTNMGTADYFTLGSVRLGQQRAFIEKHDSGAGTLKLLNLVPGLVAGAAIQLVAGDNKLATTCRDKFSNILKFGGLPLLPSKNPFDGLR